MGSGWCCVRMPLLTLYPGGVQCRITRSGGEWTGTEKRARRACGPPRNKTRWLVPAQAEHHVAHTARAAAADLPQIDVIRLTSNHMRFRIAETWSAEVPIHIS